MASRKKEGSRARGAEGSGALPKVPASTEGGLPPLTPAVEMLLYREFDPSKVMLLSAPQKQALGVVVAQYSGRSLDRKVDVPPEYRELVLEALRVLECEVPRPLRRSLKGPSKHAKHYAAELKGKGLTPPFDVRLYRADGEEARVTAFHPATGSFTVQPKAPNSRAYGLSPALCFIDGEQVCSTYKREDESN